MSVDLLATERAKYHDVWAVDSYRQSGSPGEQLVPILLDVMAHHGFPGPEHCSVLDAGCGAGRGMFALHEAGFAWVRGCDLVDVRSDGARTAFPAFIETSLWRSDRSLGAADWVYCCDVLEHIPTAFTMLVVERLLDVAKQGVFLSICHQPDQHGAWVGEALHQTVQPFVWWRDHLSQIGELIEARDLLMNGIFVVRPSC